MNNHPARKAAEWKLRGLIFTSVDYDIMLKEQDGKCAICKGVEPDGRALSLDHNHETMKIRGILCRRCNSSIAYFNEDPEILLSAVQYILQHGGGTS